MAGSRKNLRIAWVCPYPATAVNFATDQRPRSITHPTPWITLQAPLVAALPGIELHVVTIGKGYSKDYHLIDQGVHFHFLKVPNFPRGLLFFQADRARIHQCLQRIKPDLVHAFGTEEGYAYAAVTSGYPTVVRVQGIISRIVRASGGLRALLRTPRWTVPILLEKFTLRRCRTFVFETRFAAGFVREVNPAATIHLVKTPVRREFFQIERHPGPGERPEMLFVGTVTPEKGMEVLLNGVARMAQDFPQIRLHVVGAASPRYQTAVLAPLLARIGLTDRVIFHGFLSAAEIAGLMSRVTLLVLPSFMDTSPNVVAEAQAAGVPVVATAVGGIPEMVEHGVTGILVEPGSAEALAKALGSILREPAWAAQMVATARARAVAERNPEVQAQRLVEIYRQTLRKACDYPNRQRRGRNDL